MRVLVAEDDPGLRSVLERGLRRNGYVVDAVADGERALRFLRGYDYEVAVVDWRMPGLSGLEVVREVRRRGSRVPVLMLTARDTTADRVEGLDAGADEYLVGYPGGPAIHKAAESGDPTAFSFPRAMLGEGLDMSFSGIKTSVVTTVRRHPDAGNEDVAASFQQAVVDVLVEKAVRAADQIGAHGICLAGGVAANGPLRAALSERCSEAGLAAYFPSPAMCTDNAAMVAAAGWWQLTHVGPTPLDVAADPSLRLELTG